MYTIMYHLIYNSIWLLCVKYHKIIMVIFMNDRYYDDFVKFGLNVAYYRKEQQLSQEQLAELVGVSRLHISRIETANVSCSLSLVFAIADKLGVPASKLLEKR